MARAATTADVFNAIAEQRRREIVGVLAGKELAVGDIVETLGLSQPQVSKHLKVLRAVDLVDVRDEGRHRLYRLNAVPLKQIYGWISQYEQLWNERFDQVDTVLNEMKGASDDDHQGQRPADSAE